MKSKSDLYDAEEFENIREVIKHAVNKYPENNAFIIKEKNGDEINYKNITFKMLGEEIDGLGSALVKMGFKDKRIAIISPNRYEWGLAYITVLSGVGIAVPLDRGLPEEEIEFSLIRSKTDLIFFDKSNADVIKKIKERGKTSITEYVCMDEIEGFKSVKELVEEGKKLIDSGYREFLDATIDSEKMSIILFTSGTTSLAKAVMLSQKNITANIYALTKAEKVYPTDVNLAFLPYHHTFGSTALIWFLNQGVANVFCDGLRYIAQNLKEYKVSVFVCVPLLIEAMYKKIEREIEKQGKTKTVNFGKKLSKFLLFFGIDIRRKLFKQIIDQLGGNVRFIVSGASALDKKVEQGFNDFGMLTVQGYGLTETSPVLVAENAKHIRYGSIGYPMINDEILIDEPNSEGIGEIIASGPNVMLGYYENEEATNEVIEIRDGKRWFHTGDLGYMDKDGYIYISGRKKNVIVLKNGKNVYPEEIESLINMLPYVSESMVFGFPKDDDLIVSVKVVYNKDYIKEQYGEKTKEEIYEMIWNDIKEINSKLTIYKHMTKLIVTDEPMIKTTTAKIKRYEEIKNIIENEK